MVEDKSLSYEEAYLELETIVKKMEGADIPIDALVENIERASFLIHFCKERLTKIEGEVAKVIEEF